MKLEEMTKEELLAAREIHERTGATLKVAKIDKLLKFDEVMDELQNEGCIHTLESDAGPKDPLAEAYKLKAETDLPWKEIGDRVGLKAQGLYAKVKKYAKENELPYA